MYEMIPTPAVLVDLDQVHQNLSEMERINRANGIRVRPHIKPHKSCYFAQMQLDLGAQGITCARLHEAEVMADSGIRDILLAFPLIGADKMERLGKLLMRADVKTIVNSSRGAEELSALGQSLGRKIPVLIEVDGGLHRGGVAPYETTLAFAQKIRPFPGIEICGLLYYNGLIYAETTLEGYEAMTKREHDELVGTAALLTLHGFRMEILSGGNSYSARMSQHLQGITEVRCGNYIFNDVSTLATGFAGEKECCLRVHATLVCRMDSHHGIIDAGSKTLSTDLCGHRSGYGYVVGRSDIRITKLNEEHGFVESDDPLPEIGEKIEIIPNHACVVPNLTDKLYGMRRGVLERMISVDARGACC